MLGTVVITYLLDRESKNIVNGTYAKGAKQSYFDGNLVVQNVHNPKTMAGRLGMDEEKGSMVTNLAILGPLLYCLYAHFAKKGWLERFGSSMVLGGALGNWAERVQTGSVTDFLTFPKAPGKLKYLVFNLADLFIILGGIVTFLGALTGGRKRKS